MQHGRPKQGQDMRALTVQAPAAHGKSSRAVLRTPQHCPQIRGMLDRGPSNHHGDVVPELGR
ncbi:hypothetical protein AURDEDRAFT_114793 [Auricularia subglabra TFB-10046 SS5]|nr:hypothetical protein AURDEDRAFT_114793 [Auricularia subglabra TFB-10046 SS5]